MAKQEKAIIRIYGRALNYHIERKWSQGCKYKRQICSGIAMSLHLLDTPRAFSATRPGTQELLEMPCLPDFSPIPCILVFLVLYQLQEQVTCFLSNNPFPGVPSASGTFTIQQLTPLCHRGFDMCCSNDVYLRIQIWSSKRDPFILSRAITWQELCHAVLSPPADIPSLLCPRLQVPASCKWCLKGSNTVMRSARECIQPVQEHEEAGKNMKDEVFSAFQKENWEISVGNRAGGVRTGWFMRMYTRENEKQSFKLAIHLGFLLIINWISKL